MHDRFMRSPQTLESALSLIAEMREALEWQEKITKALMEAQEKWVDDRKRYEATLERVRGLASAWSAGTVGRAREDANLLFEALDDEH